jgi:hypothetical protein
MRLNHVRCDGCGNEVRADDGAYRYWGKVTIDRSNHPMRGGEPVEEFDVCPSCTDRAMPSRWARAAPPMETSG